VAAIVITSVVLIQGYRDTAAIHAKLDEIVVALSEARNEVVGLEHAEPEKIAAAVERLEQEAEAPGASRSLRHHLSATERSSAQRLAQSGAKAARQTTKGPRAEF
jgi:low affinity Fe/Cu permease